MRIFRSQPRAGRPLAMRGLSDGLRAMAKAWETLSVHNGRVEWRNGRCKIFVEGVGVGVPGRHVFPAKLGAYSSGYTWTEQFWDSTAGAWANLTGGRSGTTAEAFDDNEDVPADTIVAMVESLARDSLGEPTDPVYRFVTGTTIPEGVNGGDMLVWDTTDSKWVLLSAPTVAGEYSLRLSKSSEIGGAVTLHWDLHETFECPAEEEPPP